MVGKFQFSGVFLAILKDNEYLSLYCYDLGVLKII